MRAGWRPKSSPARESTTASMGSDLFFPASAERSRAECRLPTSARSPPAFRNATDSGSHVMDVGSATAMTPGHCDRRLVRISMPARVGATTKSSSVSPAPLTPGRRTTTWWLATTAASMPIATGLVASSGTRVLLSLLRTSVPRSELTDGRMDMYGRTLGRAHALGSVLPSHSKAAGQPRRSPMLVGHPMRRTRPPAPAATAPHQFPQSSPLGSRAPATISFTSPKLSRNSSLPRPHPETTLRGHLSDGRGYRY
jgi:hypothetical protein